uniref:NADH dehydrogenase subunit 5 n=1 Tax=Corynosoma villosum TaxID=141829 RepID=UPI002E785ADA|nr:NADH dehydrogenase subunit 5 [Corynosoma villosum]WPN89823.1 NADH dehydrogenase subunit 5 [Corynosoma villosum]
MVNVTWSVVSLWAFVMWAGLGLLVYMYMSGVYTGWGVLSVVEEGYDFGVIFGDKGYGMVGVLMIVYLLVSLFGSYYMSGGDSGYFSWLVFFFVGGVVVLLLSGSLYSLLVGWEILGVVSFILIGFYCTRSSWGSALFTVLINRMGDVGVLLLFWSLVSVGGMLWGWSVSVSFVAGLMVSICILTKSAQMPFGGWLPLAMAAPTPVSALVHSSTLVIAGLYVGWFMVEGMFGGLGFLVGVVGVATLVSAGLSSVFEMDFKKVVAYSTSMHLGLMLCMALWVSWVFMGVHMELHAFFKSLLFVGVGYVILMVCHDQDYRGFSMGGVISGIVGVLVISSLWSLVGWTYFSGWFTKDGFMEYLVFQGLGLVLWAVVMAALATSGVYSLKLLMSVMMKSLAKVPLVLDWSGVLCVMWGVIGLGAVLGSVVGYMVGVWLDWGFSVCVLSFSEKALFWVFVCLVFIVWVFVGSLIVGSGFSVYVQGLYQYLVAGLSYWAFKGVSDLENCWLLGLVGGVLSVLSSSGYYLVNLLGSLDWYFVFIMVLVGLCFGMVV